MFLQIVYITVLFTHLAGYDRVRSIVFTAVLSEFRCHGYAVDVVADMVTIIIIIIIIVVIDAGSH